MNEEETFNQIVNILTKYIDTDNEVITPDTRFISDLHMNSIDIITVVSDMEDNFNATVEIEDLYSIFTVSDLVSYTEKYV